MCFFFIWTQTGSIGFGANCQMLGKPQLFFHPHTKERGTQQAIYKVLSKVSVSDSCGNPTFQKRHQTPALRNNILLILYYICRNSSLPKSCASDQRLWCPSYVGSSYAIPLEAYSRQRWPSPIILPVFQTIFFSARNSTTTSFEYFSQCRLTSWHKVFRTKLLMYCLDFPSLTL